MGELLTIEGFEDFDPREFDALPDEDAFAAEEARRDFRAFIPYAWPIIEPGAPFLPSLEIEAMAVHLEAVTRGQIQDLVINIRPRASKSRVSSVLWPVWDWLQDPTAEFLTASFDLSLAREHAGLSRKLVESDWFRQRYGYLFPVEPRVGRSRSERLPSPLARDKNAEGWYRNTASGVRRIASPRSGTTGRGGTRLIFDDPHDAQRVESQEEREHTVKWMRRAFFTRRNNEKTGARIVLGQRTHHGDAFRYIQDFEPSFVWVVLATRYDPARRRPPTPIGWEDPRTEPGEMLANPERFGEKEDAAARVTLGDDYAAQHDQEPTAAGGTTFRLEDFRRYRFQGEAMRRGVQLPDTDAYGHKVVIIPDAGPGGQAWARFFDELCQSWDFTFKGSADTDMVAGQVWGRKGPDFFLLHQVRARLDFAACIGEMLQLSALYPVVFSKLVEDAANGPGIVSMLQSQLLGLELVGTGGKSKPERARSISPLVRGGNVYVPEDFVTWGPESSVALYLEELRTFPKGAHDDQVDATSQALLRLFKGYQEWLESIARATGTVPVGLTLGMGLPLGSR